MNVLEKELEELFYQSLKEGKTKQLRERGFLNTGYDVYIRQANIGSYGIADVLGFRYNHDRKVLTVGVHEFKKSIIDQNAFFQAIRYARGIKSYVTNNSCIDVEFDIILIGTSIDKGDFIYLPSIVNDIFLYTVSIDLEKGVRFFLHENYVLERESFANVDKNFLSGMKSYIKKEINNHIDSRRENKSIIDAILGTGNGGDE